MSPLNTPDVVSIAQVNMPVARTVMHPEMQRQDIASLLKGASNIGIELGVSYGRYSALMVQSQKFEMFFGVDIYADHHNVAEYRLALSTIGLLAPFKLLRMTFDEASHLFNDNFFDFIYIDGYAHGGQDGGSTLIDWFPKLKVGGIMSGDDYHDDWPLTKWAVNHLADQLDVEIHLTGEGVGSFDSNYPYPSWFFTKEQVHSDLSISPLEKLAVIAKEEKRRIESKEPPAMPTSWIQNLKGLFK